MIRTVYLDLDGPVLDGKFRHYSCYSEILHRFGYKPMELEQYWGMKRLRQDRNKQLAASGATGIYNDFIKLWLEMIEDKIYLKLDQLHPLVSETLKSWKSQDIRIILVTMRNRRDNLLWQLEQLALLPLFDDIIAVGSKESGEAKSEAVRNFITSSSNNSDLWVGDTEIDLKAARSLGIPICLLSCGLREAEYLKSLEPDYLMQDLASIHNLRILNI